MPAKFKSIFSIRSNWSRLVGGLFPVVVLLGSTYRLFGNEALWQVGVSRAVITPREPVWLAGYGTKRVPEGTIHDLWLKVLAVRDTRGKLGVLITSDFQGVPKSVSDRVFTQLQEHLGLERAAVVWAFSHNHCGPRLGDDLQDYYPVEEQQEQLVTQYTERMIQVTVTAVQEASANLAPARLFHATGTATFAVNRRNNPEAEVPRLLAAGIALAGPVDHRVPILIVTTPEKVPRAVLFGYACHPTTMSFAYWCGDYPGFAQIFLEQRYSGLLALFVNTTGGDQNPLPRRELELCRSYGQRLAEAVIEQLERPTAWVEVTPHLEMVFQYVPLAYERVVDRGELQSAAQQPRNAIHQRWAARLLKQLEQGVTFDASYPYPVHVWRLGDQLLWIAMGGETVVDYGLRFSREYGTGTWVLGYTDDLVAYIPSRRVWEEGGYEGGSFLYEYGRPAYRWAGDVEDRIATAVLSLVRSVGWPHTPASSPSR